MTTQELVRLRKQIEGPIEDARFSAWMELYLSSDPEAIQELERIVSGVDPILKILLLRFLSHVHEERAALFIRNLLDDENPNVVQNARRAFEKNQFSDKLRLLLPLLKSPQKSVLYHAVEKLSLGGIHQAMDELLKLLSRNDPNDTGTLIRLLTALRHLPDKRVIPFLIKYQNDPFAEIRRRVAHILGALYHAGHGETKKRLLAFLQDQEASIRQSVLWILRKKTHRSDVKYFLRYSVDDPDAMVRQEALQGLAFFPSPHIIEHLLTVLIHENDRLVSLKSEGLLMNMPPHLLTRGLEKILKNQKVRHKALLLLAELQPDSKVYADYLVRELQTATEKDKIPIVTALGIVGRRESTSTLESCLVESQVLGYAAMSSLLKINDRFRHLPLLDYLEDERLSALLKQMIFKSLIKKGTAVINATISTSEDLRRLFAFLSSENLNLRYLAAQTLFLTQKDEVFESLLQSLFQEKDPTSLKFLKESILKMFQSNPDLLIRRLALFVKHRDASGVRALFRMLDEARLPSPSCDDLISKLLAPSLGLLSSEHSAPLASFLTSVMEEEKVSVDFVFSQAKTDVQKRLLLEAFLKESEKTSRPLRLPSFIGSWFMEGDDSIKAIILDLMSHGISEEVLPFLIGQSTNAKSAFQNRAALNLLKLWENL